jgi:hypothetical protein
LQGLSGKALGRTVLSFHKSAEIIISALLPKDRYPSNPFPLCFSLTSLFFHSQRPKNNMEFSSPFFYLCKPENKRNTQIKQQWFKLLTLC